MSGGIGSGGVTAPAARLQRLGARLRGAWASVLVHSRLCRRFTIRTHGIAVRFTPAAMSRVLWTNPRAYDRDLEFYERFLKPGDRVVDAGANIGLVALVAARLVGPRGFVHAIEAHPRTFTYLRDNVRLNGARNVALHQVALGAADGTLVIAGFSGDDSQNFVPPDGPGLRVRAARLDDLLLAIGPIALLKVDVEGYERFVLQGAARLLGVTECVHFESWQRHCARYGHACSDVFAELTARGFGIYRRLGPRTLAPVPGRYVSTECENLIATRDVEALLQRTGYRLAGGGGADDETAARPPARMT